MSNSSAFSHLLPSIHLFVSHLFSSPPLTSHNHCTFPSLSTQDEPFTAQTFGSCSYKMNEEWSTKTDIDCPEDSEREREKDLKERDKDNDEVVATVRPNFSGGSGMAPLKIPTHSVSVRMEEGTPLSSPRRAIGTSARLPATPHPRTVYPSSESDTVVDVSYVPSDWDEEAYKVEEEIDTDDDVAQIERARRIRDGGIESDAEVLRKTMCRMEIGSEDSETEAEVEDPHSIPRARERAEALLADTDTGMRPVLWIPRYRHPHTFLHLSSLSADHCVLLKDLLVSYLIPFLLSLSLSPSFGQRSFVLLEQGLFL
jgi:hypothetical protein